MPGSLVTMSQSAMTLKARLSVPVSPECTEAVLQAAIADESRRLYCGTVHVTAMISPPAATEPAITRFKPYAWLNFHSDLAAAVFASQAGAAAAEGGRRVLIVAGVQVSWGSAAGKELEGPREGEGKGPAGIVD